MDIGLADANVQRRLNATAEGQRFLAVWPFVSAGLDIATLMAENIVDFIQTRQTAATILQQEGQLEAADKLEQMESIIEYSDELNDALQITRIKFTQCGCGTELTDGLVDRIILNAI